MLRFITKSKFKKDLAFSYIVQIFTALLGLLQVFLINKYFGIVTYGQLAIIMSTAGIFSSLLTARSAEAVTRFFKIEIANNRIENAKFVLYIGFFIDLITAFTLLLLVYFLSDVIAKIFLKNSDLSVEIFLYSFIIFFIFMRDTLTGYLQANEMFNHINSIRLIESFLKNAFLLIPIYASVCTLRFLIFSFFAASFLSFVFALYVYLNKYLKELSNIPLVINKVLFKEYWNYNVKTFLSSSLKAGNENIDNLVIAYYLDAKTVGIYQVLKKILSPIFMFSSPFSMLIYPKLISFYDAGQRDRFKNIILKTSSYLALLTVVYGLITYISLPGILSILGTNYTSMYSNYYIALIFLTFIVIMMWWVRIFSNTVDPSYSLYMNIFATIFQLTVTILMAKSFGIFGLIISMLVMNVIIFSYWLRKAYCYVNNHI